MAGEINGRRSNPIYLLPTGLMQAFSWKLPLYYSILFVLLSFWTHHDLTNFNPWIYNYIHYKVLGEIVRI